MLTPTLTNIGESSNQLIAEMIRNQLQDIQKERRLSHPDFRRIVKYLDQSIFIPNVCTIWQGYVTDRSGRNKGSYINFYFRKKKMALHRLLYINFLGSLADDEYVRFKCKNKGYCCSLHCLEKNKYRVSPNSSKNTHCDSNDTPNHNNEPNIISDDKLNIFFI